MTSNNYANAAKNEVSLIDHFYGFAGVHVNHQYVFKYKEIWKNLHILRVIKQNDNKKLKNQKCWQRTSLNV